MQKKKRIRKILIGLLIVIVLLAVGALVFVGNFLFDFALNPKGSYTMKDMMRTGEVSGMEHADDVYEDVPETIQNWYDYCDLAGDWFTEEGESVYLTSKDGLELHGWEFQNEGTRYAIICHGYLGVPKDMAVYAMKFHDLGFSVLVPAAQAHEESGGEYYGMGWPERKHMLDWIDHILEKEPEAEICLMGVSMGGATVMMTAGEELPENVKCIIDDCGYSSVWDEFKLQLQNVFHLPEFPILPLANLICKVRAGYDFKEASAVEQLRKAEVPMLFIHGEEDTFVPYSMLDVVYEACASEEKQKLSVPKAKHGASVFTDPELYWETVEGFLEKHF